MTTTDRDSVVLQPLLIIVVKIYPEHVKHEVILPIFLEGSKCCCQLRQQQWDSVRSHGCSNSPPLYKILSFLVISARFSSEREASVLVALVKSGGHTKDRDTNSNSCSC